MMENHFADIILPLAVKGTFTYSIPEELNGKISQGSRVLVQFGNRKLYSGIVYKIHDESPSAINIRPVSRVLDPAPVVNEIQLKLWLWISEYYLCSVGEVMKAALPSDMCLEGVTEVPVPEKYRPREETFVKLASDFTDNELNEILDKLAKAPIQFKILTDYISLSGYADSKLNRPVKKSVASKGKPSRRQEVLTDLYEKEFYHCFRWKQEGSQILNRLPNL